MIKDIIFKDNPIVGNRELRDLGDDMIKIFVPKEKVFDSIHLEGFINELRDHLNYLKGNISKLSWFSFPIYNPCSFYISWEIGEDEYGYQIGFEEDDIVEYERLYKIIDTCPELIFEVDGQDKSIKIGDLWPDWIDEDHLLESDTLDWPILPKIPEIKTLMWPVLKNTFMPTYYSKDLSDAKSLGEEESKMMRIILINLFHDSVDKITKDWKFMIEGKNGAPHIEIQHEDLGGGFNYLLSILPSIIKTIEKGGTFIDPATFNCNLHFLLVKKLPGIIGEISRKFGNEETPYQYIMSLEEPDINDYINQFVEF